MLGMDRLSHAGYKTSTNCIGTPRLIQTQQTLTEVNEAQPIKGDFESCAPTIPSREEYSSRWVMIADLRELMQFHPGAVKPRAFSVQHPVSAPNFCFSTFHTKKWGIDATIWPWVSI
jgi:hypothetical protein